MTKYWGKRDAIRNTPATPSLAVTLDGLRTVTEVDLVARVGGDHDDAVVIAGVEQPLARFRPFFRELRKLATEAGWIDGDFVVRAVSDSDFPMASGIASSASGFAALAVCCIHALDVQATDQELSALARIGSASAARSIFGGFTLLPAGADSAHQVFDESWWPDLRIVVVEVEKMAKPILSRRAMEETRRSSPYYNSWLADAEISTEAAIEALGERNLSLLGPVIRRSYMRMFATMLSADPPIRYWTPGTIRVLGTLEGLRRDGIGAWETMDAGPQVKVFCLRSDLDEVVKRLEETGPGMNIRVCGVGTAPRVI